LTTSWRTPAGERAAENEAVLASAAGRVPPQPAAVQLCRAEQHRSAAYPAGASTAAGFLSHFVENYHKGWLHIDCSATYRKAAVEQWSAGATGLGVRTVANLLTAE
jgi:PepB aminopeptidase